MNSVSTTGFNNKVSLNESEVNNYKYALPFKISIKKDTKDFVANSKSKNPYHLKGFYKNLPLLKTEYRDYITKDPINVYISYLFLIKFPGVDKNKVKEIVVTNTSIYDALKTLNPEKPIEIIDKEAEAFVKYKQYFLSELKLYNFYDKIGKMQRLLANIFIQDQDKRTKVFIKIQQKRIKVYYDKALVAISKSKCSPEYWSSYEYSNKLYNIAKQNNIKPYILIYGTSYEKRNLNPVFKSDEFINEIKTFLKNVNYIFDYKLSYSIIFSEEIEKYYSYYERTIIEDLDEEICELYYKKLFNTFIEYGNKCYIKLK